MENQQHIKKCARLGMATGLICIISMIAAVETAFAYAVCNTMYKKQIGEDQSGTLTGKELIAAMGAETGGKAELASVQLLQRIS